LHVIPWGGLSESNGVFHFGSMDTYFIVEKLTSTVNVHSFTACAASLMSIPGFAPFASDANAPPNHKNHNPSKIRKAMIFFLHIVNI